MSRFELREEPAQPNDSCVNSDDVAELLESRSESVGDSNLLDGVVEEVAQERR